MSLITAFGNDRTRARAETAGAVAVPDKPLAIDELPGHAPRDYAAMALAKNVVGPWLWEATARGLQSHKGCL